jgi:ATP-binding cassette subfamily B protein
MWHWLWALLRQQKGRAFSVLLLDCLAWPLDAVVWPYLLGWVVTVMGMFDSDRSQAWAALQLPAMVALTLVVFVEVASRAQGFLMARLVPVLQEEIRLSMFDHIQRHSIRYFNERFSGSLANKITDMTSQVESILMILWWPIIPSIAAVTMSVGIFLLVHPVFAMLLAVWLVFHVGIALYFARSCAIIQEIHGQSRSHLLGKIVDSLANFFSVNLFYRFNYELSRMKANQLEECASNILARQTVEKMRCYTSACFFLVFFLGMNSLLLWYWLENTISTGQFIQIFTTNYAVAGIAWAVGSAFPVLYQSIGTLQQAFELMLDPQDLGDRLDAKELHVSRGEIRFEAVGCSHGERKVPGLYHVAIRPGERVGLVGYTGAGKSTFVQLLLRMMPITEGKITIDGQSIAEVTGASLRRQMTLVPQDPSLFHRTIRENIAYALPEATDSQISEAAARAHCHGFISDLPNGYDSKVGERGTKLSGGERQRIAIARAFLADAPILILDEATSALDAITEGIVQQSLMDLMKDRTTIVVAHRLATLAGMDRLLVFDRGVIVEDGSHDELLAKEGLYAQMWRMQVGGFLRDHPPLPDE